MKTSLAISRTLPLLVANIIFGFTVAAVPEIKDSHVPTRVSYQDLLNLLEDNNGDSMEKQALFANLQSNLRDVGIFSISDIPFFGNEKPQTLGKLPACVDALLQQSDKFPGNAASHMFPDGTIRKTIATRGDKESLFGFAHDGDLLPMECTVLQQMSGAFRDTVAEVTRTVSQVLMHLLQTDDKSSSKALVWNQAGDKSYNLADIVAHGEHLEHFHVYNKPNAMEPTGNPTTIDWHTDQGLMLVFSPGMVDGTPAGNDFYIQLADGQAVPVAFDSKDELVVLMGEGVNQYVNNQIEDSQSMAFRAVPHSLSLHTLKGDRVWYGRMVLPPADAVHPVQKRTFGELRHELIASNSNDNSPPLALGCGSGGTVEQQHRQLQDVLEEDCNLESQHFCWHRCMNHTEEVSPTACADVVTSDGPHEVACYNPNTTELWSGDHNMNFRLECVASDIVAAFQNATEEDLDEEENIVTDEDEDEPKGNGETAGSSGAPKGKLGVISVTATVMLWLSL